MSSRSSPGMSRLWAAGMAATVLHAQTDAPLPQGVTANWDVEQAHRETTPTRERICLNGLWRWQPAEATSEQVPDDGWGFFKVPGSWPGITDYMQKDCQTVHAHPQWQAQPLAGVRAAWHQREISVPQAWTGRRITLHAEYLNSYAAVYVDGTRAGELRFPGGEVDLSAACRPGQKHRLSLLVVALPLKGVMLSHHDSNAAREVPGAVARRGLCGDVWLASAPTGAGLAEVQVIPSVRHWNITFAVGTHQLSEQEKYRLRARVNQPGMNVGEFTSAAFGAGETQNGRMTFTEPWRPEHLWDIHTPENQYEVTVSLLNNDGVVLDTAYPERFGFREFWIDGRDFYLNGTRIFLSVVPFDNAQVGAAWAAYAGARESLERLQQFGINAVYTHNYGCEPGSHLGFAEILRAADDLGMLVALSQPHFSHYDWTGPDADHTNGYGPHAAFYAAAARNHPSVVLYAMSHNATGYNEDMNPDRIDGLHEVRDGWSQRNAERAVRAEAIVRALDPSRIVYHHSSGNLGSMHTSNFYPNWVPIQELSDWFGHWATAGIKPFFACEYGAPFTWDWAMYRGWFQGQREFGSAAVPWDFCLAEWNAQFLGDTAYHISDPERRNLRWEARQFKARNGWHRWDYPHPLGSRDFDERYPVLAAYLSENWRAFRTWGVSGISPWEHGVFWKPRAGLDRNRRIELPTDWDRLQRPGFSPDYLAERYERMDLAYERTDWIATPAAEAMYRNNRPLLAYLAGKPAGFTSKDHNFLPGETVEKQIIVINNSRRSVTADCAWFTDLPQAASGREEVHVATGDQARIPIRIDLPPNLAPGAYALRATVRFGPGKTQQDQFTLQVLPPATARARPFPEPATRIALFDPKGETRRLLAGLGVVSQPVGAAVDLADYDLLIIGKGALTPAGPAPAVGRVRDGLRVIVFEQTAEALEQRLGLRVQEYGLRTVFARVPDHPCLDGIKPEHLRDWRGEATLLPTRLDCRPSAKYNGAPAVRWCGLEVPRLWRCGNRGTVASVLIEKPAIGDFLPILEGGFSLQYSPLLEYREGTGLILFCQLDVTGRSEADPAAMHIVRNILSHGMHASPTSPVSPPAHPTRRALYLGDAAGRQHLEVTGIAAGTYPGDDLAPDHVLVVGPGGGRQLAEQAPAIARWLQAGGRLLALELEAAEANLFLPTPIQTTRQEHIAAWFPPPAVESPFAGAGPADVHNRDPRELPLVTGGATALGNGVLAQADGGRIVYCQLAPYRFTETPGEEPKQANLRKTFRRSSFLLTRLLANLGVRGETPLLLRISTPVGETPEGPPAGNSRSRDDTGADRRWLDGLYVDRPQEWDDPYRFFRW